MTITRWIVPRVDIPAAPSSGGSGFSFVPGGRSLTAIGVTPATIIGGLDRLIDPVTRSYVRTDTGDWAETQDSRTIVFIALSLSLGASPFDPNHGTAIAQQLRAGLGLTPEFLKAETQRVFDELRDEGILADAEIQVRDSNRQPLMDKEGRAKVKTSWRDLASGSPINAAFTPR